MAPTSSDRRLPPACAALRPTTPTPSVPALRACVAMHRATIAAAPDQPMDDEAALGRYIIRRQRP